MTSAVFDFSDIRSRMLGDLKPQPNREEPPAVPCSLCEGCGWVECYSPRPPAFTLCTRCFNPESRPCP